MTITRADRYAAMELLSGGVTEADIARRYRVSREAVRKWKNAYLENRLEPVDIGRRPRVHLDDVAPWVARAAARPTRYGLPSRWGAEDLRQLLERRMGVDYSYPRVYAILRQLGYVFRQGEGWTQRSDAARKRRREPPWGYAYDAAGRLAREPTEHRVVCVVRHMHLVTGLGARAIAGALRKMGVKGRDGRSLGMTDIARMLRAR